ncbi:hypothetical protein GIB67_016263 [Kingdonia uniflora]|uniref:Uncharacterized protein n=1 Tax=Kingdonia uniflora TaxID=39325 RepID=A0A7J7M985_9MAGN|nr:hypothetical protein GIB67_016263 [Kingdonia uniflora]
MWLWSLLQWDTEKGTTYSCYFVLRFWGLDGILRKYWITEQDFTRLKALGHDITSWGLEKLLEFLKLNYKNPAVVIHEDGNPSKNGSNGQGYFVWAFIDCIEFLSGYSSHFGLYGVDFIDKDRKRYLRESASWLRKTVKGRPIPKTSIEGIVAQKADDDEEDYEDLDSRAASGIRLCLAKNVLANVVREKTVNGLWERLESLYQMKSLLNRLYLKERLHTLWIDEGTSVGDHLGSLNGIVSELESIRVKV